METLQQPDVEQQNAEKTRLEELNTLVDYDAAMVQLRRVVNDWTTEIEETEKRRKTRDVQVDVQSLRQKGKLDEDETLVPVRTIDVNIQRELPPYINYLKNSRRLATFHSLTNPSQDPQLLEQEFTRGMTYLGWETPHYKCLDGSCTHGWDAVEVVFNPLHPLNVGIEHIGHDMLYFPQSVTDIQQSPEIIRAYDFTKIQLKKFVDEFGFVKEQVDKLLDARKSTQKENETIRIYKRFYKYEGVVFVCWFSTEHGCTSWLSNPTKLFLGIRSKDATTGEWVDKDVTQYPIFLLPYRESEKPKITDRKGRVFLDGNKQEAQTAILSGFINGLTRASGIYASPKTEDGSGGSIKALENTKMTPGRIMNKPIEFWHPDYPDALVLKSLQYFDLANSQETNQPNFAAINREDSRKTAKEITVAEQQQQLLNSVQLTLFSTYVRAVYSFAWLIVQSQALQNKIIFLQIEKQRPLINPVTNMPVINPQTGQPEVETYYENNYAVIAQVYDVRAAGDVDVVQRQEKLNQMMQDWPVISQTPLRDRFLADMIKLKYPDTGEAYAAILMQTGQMQMMQSMIGRLATVLDGAVKENPDMFNALSAQEKADLAQLMNEAHQVTPFMQKG